MKMKTKLKEHKKEHKTKTFQLPNSNFSNFLAKSFFSLHKKESTNKKINSEKKKQKKQRKKNTNKFFFECGFSFVLIFMEFLSSSSFPPNQQISTQI